MRAVTIIALLIALVALGIAGSALTGAAAAKTDLVAEKARADALGQRIDQLQQQLDAAKTVKADDTKPAAITATAKPVGGDTGGGAVTVQLAPAAPVDDEHIKKVVQDELQAQFQRMRQGFAGGGPGGGGWGQAQLADAAAVKSQLGVDDDQKAEQAAKIIADMRSATRDVWRGGGDRDANMKKMQDLRTEAETKLAGVLTADQLAKAKQLLDQGGGRRRGGGPGQGGGADPQPGGQAAPAEPPKGTSF